MCSVGAHNKSIRYTSVQTAQDKSDSPNDQKIEKIKISHATDLMSSTQLTEEKLIEHESQVKVPYMVKITYMYLIKYSCIL